MNLKSRRKMTSYIVKFLLPSLFVLGCGSTSTQVAAPMHLTQKEQQAIQVQPLYLQHAYTKLYQEGKRNQTLNLMEIGKKAFVKGDLDAAELAFEQALSQIESVYADNNSALQARSLWHEEGRKDFKGEPYERAMAYYYRGLIYLVKGEYDNARATFYGGLLQDSFAEEEQHRADFALLLYLAGWSALKMGSDSLAQDHFDELQSIRPNLTLPSTQHNTLVLAETGKAPRKLSDGVGHFELVFRRGKGFKDKYASAVVNEQHIALQPIEDVFFQASSRGGRPIDAIIEGKASYRANAESFGSIMSELGTNTTLLTSLSSEATGNAGSIISLIGVTALAISSNVKPKADVRYWKSLPDVVHIHPVTLSSDNIEARYQFLDAERKPVPSDTGRHHVYTDANGNSVIWSHSQNL